jgi:4-amino-4-deoxychorismate lyase
MKNGVCPHISQIEQNSPFYFPELHQERLIAAARFFKWTRAESHRALADTDSWIQFLDTEIRNFQTQSGVEISTPLKVRVDLTPEGDMKTSNVPVPSVTLAQLYPAKLASPEDMASRPTYKIVMDWIPTEITPYTWLKTANRSDYDTARQRMVQALSSSDNEEILCRGECEIILHNPLNEVTEGSVTNIYFWRNGWVTPRVGKISGGLEGVARRWALESRLCSRVERIAKDSVEEGECVWISNGVRGFNSGRVVSIPGPAQAG